MVIDEQHRFGVNQRAELLRNSNQISEKILPHFLSMSATPIPRTLTLTIFGDLDLSIIDELPKNRKLIITKIVASANRDKAYAFIRGQVKKRKTGVCDLSQNRIDGRRSEINSSKYYQYLGQCKNGERGI